MKKEYAMAAFSIFCWGTMAPVSKILLSGLSNMEVLFYGSAIAAIVLLLVILLSGKWRLFCQYTVKDYLQLFNIGFVGYFLYSAFYYHGLTVLPAQVACILNYLWPILTVCLSCLLLKESFSSAKFLALLLSFTGVIVVTFQPGANTSLNSSSLTGYICCIVAAFLYALFNVLNKKKGGSQLINMFVYISISAVFAFFCCLRTGFSPISGSQIAGLLWLGIFIDAAGFLLWAMALQAGNSATIANFAYATPALSIFLSCLLLDEPIYLTSFIGLGFILCGFFLQMYLSR